MYRIETLEEAIKYISEKYVFDDEKYPHWHVLEKAERSAFAINHLLLEIMENLPHLVEQIQKESARDTKKYEEAVVNILIDIIKSLLMLDVHPRKIIYAQQHENTKTQHLLNHVGLLASELVKINRGNPGKVEVATKSLMDLFGSLQCIVNEQSNIMIAKGEDYMTFHQAISKIPEYMKSK